MTPDPLDQPVWSALAGEQAHFAVGGERARRYHPEIGMLAGVPDHSPESLAALADLARETGEIVVMQKEALPPVAELTILRQAEAVQMIFAGKSPEANEDSRVIPLGPEHAEAMLALATLTRPGPFASRTHELGQFWGVIEDGRLAAMAGQRLRFAGHVEVSGVCTHPDFRGRGYGELLSNRVIAAVLAEGRTPILQAYADNKVAIKLYGRIGFVHARNMVISFLQAASD